MSASSHERALSPEAVRFALAFDRLAADDQARIARLIDLLTDPRTRTYIESLVLASDNLLEDLRQGNIPGVQALQ